jgi:hypothetical protein
MDEYLDGADFFGVDAVTWIVEVEGERRNDNGWIGMLETTDWAEAMDEAERLHEEDGRAVRVRHYANEGYFLDLFIPEEVRQEDIGCEVPHA